MKKRQNKRGKRKKEKKLFHLLSRGGGVGEREPAARQGRGAEEEEEVVKEQGAAQTVGGPFRCSRYWWMSSVSLFSQAALRRMFSQHCCTVRSAAGAWWLSKKLWMREGEEVCEGVMGGKTAPWQNKPRRHAGSHQLITRLHVQEI